LYSFFRFMKFVLISVLLVLVVGHSPAQNFNLDSLKRQAAIATGKPQIESLIELSWAMRYSNADSAREYGIQALQLSRQLKLPELEVEALNNIGITHEAQGNYEQALAFELPALVLRKKIGNDYKTAQTLNNIGIVYDEKGDYQKAINYYLEARKIYEARGDQAKIAMVISNIGIVLKAQKEYRKAITSYTEALKIYRHLNQPLGMASCHANLGSAFFNLNQYDSALHYALLAAREFGAINNKQFLAAAMCNAGMAFHKLGKQQQAIETLLQAKKLYEEYDNKKELAFLLIYLAEIELETKNYGRGIVFATQGRALAKAIGSREEVMKAHQILSRLYAAQNNFARALAERLLYDQEKDSLFELTKVKQISELQAKYESEKKENQITLLTEQNEIKDIRLHQNTILLISLGFLLMVVVAFGWLWRNRINLKQKARLEAERAELRQSQLQAVIASQEEERRRFAADLHDGLGQIISAIRLGLSKEKVEADSIDYSLRLLHDMNLEIRNIAFNLMPQVLMKEGLHDALKELAHRVNQTGSVYIDVQTHNLNPALDSTYRIALYRICQEWINNVLKYSACKKITLQAIQHPDELVITIEDDGTGFDADLLTHGKGNGWKNINSRLSLIHGKIEIDSLAGRKGTIVILTVPVPAANPF